MFIRLFTMKVLVALLAALKGVDAFPTRVVCDREFVVGAPFMNGDNSILSDDRFLYVEKDGVEVSSGDAYEVDASYTVEMKTADGSAVAGQFLFQILGSTFDCDSSTCDCSRAVNTNGMAFVGGSGSDVVELYAGWATGFGVVRFTETFQLVAPEVLVSIIEVARSTGIHTIVVAALEAADLDVFFSLPASYTVFAPDDAAFAKLDSATLDFLLLPENADQLTAILTYHVLGSVVLSTDLSDGMTAATLQGSEVTVSIEGGTVMINDATVTIADIMASNGVVHSVDTVLIPPTADPTASPAAGPTATPAADPTAMPAAGPTAVSSCGDDEAWFKNGEPAKGCAWVAAKNETRCQAKNENAIYAFEMCKSACGACGVACEDDPTWFKEGEEEKDCSWAGQLANRWNRLNDEGTFAWKACRAATMSCEQSLNAACGDDLSWFKRDEPEKGCDWVAGKESRCRTKNDNKIFAFAACRDACGSCSEECVDSATWHKAGDPSKDCAWVSRVSNRRVSVGEDGTYAYESCLYSSKTCNY